MINPVTKSANISADNIAGTVSTSDTLILADLLDSFNKEGI